MILLGMSSRCLQNWKQTMVIIPEIAAINVNRVETDELFNIDHDIYNITENRDIHNRIRYDQITSRKKDITEYRKYLLRISF